jgi:hypothetical protein
VSQARRAVATPERARPVSVGVDHERHAGLGGRARVHVVQVAPVGIRVDLEERACLHRLGDHGVQVQRVRLAALDQPSRRMADHVHERMLHRLQHPLCLLLLGQAERGVEACDDPVELLEHVVRVVD